MQAILSAANAEFAENGFHGARITRIAERAQVSPGSMYRFFPDKDSLGAALAKAHLDEVIERYRSIEAKFDAYDDIPMLLERLLHAVAELQVEFPGFYRMTNDVSPAGQSWVGQGVQARLVEALTQALIDKRIGPAADAPPIEVIIAFLIETGRARLATIPADAETRTQLLNELTKMLTLYATARLRPLADDPS